MKKNIFIIVSIFIIVFTLISLSQYIDKQNNYIISNNVKKIIPIEIKNYIKNFYNSVFEKHYILELKIKNLEKNLDETKIELTNLKNYYKDTIEILNYPSKLFIFKKTITEEKKLGTEELLLTKFTLPLLKFTGPRSYINYYNNNFYLITGTGILMYTDINNFRDEKIKFKEINTNISNYISKEYMKKIEGIGLGIVKGFLFKNNKIYISYLKKTVDDCYTTSILVGNVNTNNIFFEEFFDMSECQILYSYQSGGALSDYRDNQILMSIGDYNQSRYPNPISDSQDDKSEIGKIISINENNSNYRIISMGHRNPQGIFYDKPNNIIYSTEHGPVGGDEVNINQSPNGKIKNYGWPISSYGEHYEIENLHGGKRSPLYKSHNEHGFIEPLIYFTPSIAPTKIIKNDKFIKINNKNILYLSAMGKTLDEGDLSIHQLILNKDLKIEQHNILPINERVRDIIYIEELNQMFMFLETSGSIGILDIKKN